MKRTLIISLIALLGASACHKEQIQTVSDNEIRFDIGLNTKVSASAFEFGDKLSLWAVECIDGQDMPLQIGGNFINNEQLTYNGTDWSASQTLYWNDSPCDFYALYPFQNLSSVESQSFSIATNQNSEKSGDVLGGYEASDLMFAKAFGVSRSDGPVQLRFYHMMARCKVCIIKGENFEGDIPNDIAVHIYNTVTDARVNTTKGTLEKDAFGAKKTITMKKIDNQTFEAIVIPQNIENRTPLIEVTMGGIAYLLEYSLSFKPAYTHTINLTLNTSPDQEQIEISIDPSIHNW